MALKIFDKIKNALDEDQDAYGGFIMEQMHSTGFQVIDYMNGQMVAHDNGTYEKALGIDAGKIITIIGKSGVGKSTLGLQMGYNIISKYENGNMFVLDFERATTKARFCSVTGISEAEYDSRVTLKNVGISTETVLAMASKIKEIKLAHKAELMCDHADGVIDPETGKVMKIMPPTVLFVDSIAVMAPKVQVKKEEISGQMDATQMAKMNTQLFKRLPQVIAEANIICIFINHINKKIDSTPMPSQASLNYLKQDETLPGKQALLLGSII